MLHLLDRLCCDTVADPVDWHAHPEVLLRRVCPAADPRFTYRGEDVVQTLERVCGQIVYPRTIRVDKGSEFVSRDLDLWAYANDATLDF